MRTPLVRFRPPRFSRSGLIESAEPRCLSFTLSEECEDGVEAIQKCEEALPGDTTSGRPVSSALSRIRKEEGRGRCPRPEGKGREAASSLGTRWEREGHAGDGGATRQEGEGRFGALFRG